jgi:hypothetical protein
MLSKRNAENDQRRQHASNKSDSLITNETLRRNEDDRSGGVAKEFVAIRWAVLHN